jgi:hypothetical protein
VRFHFVSLFPLNCARSEEPMVRWAVKI